MTDILAGLGYRAAKKWILPAVLGGGLGLALGLAAAAGAWIWQGKEITSLEGQLKGVAVERDIFEASAKAQAAGARDQARVIDGQSRQIDLLTTAWRSTRADAEHLATQSKARATVYAEAERKIKELSHDPKADPADIALRNFECLRKLREAGSAATAGAC
nr:hypothetical protein [uncultured Dongia sp.]